MTVRDAYTLGRRGGSTLWSDIQPKAAVMGAARRAGTRTERAYLLGLARFIREARS